MVEFSLGRTYVSILPFGPWGLFEFFCRLGEYEKGLRVGFGFFFFFFLAAQRIYEHAEFVSRV